MKWILTLIAVSSCGLALSLPVRAGGCGTPYYPTTYNYSTIQYVDRIVPVAYPVPFTVAIPVVSYLYNGATFSPVFAAQPASPGVPVQAAPQQPTAAQTGQPATLTEAQIDAIIDRIEKRLKERSESKGSPPPPIASNGSGDAIAAELLSTPVGRGNLSCSSCHTGQASKGNTVIFLADGSLNPRANKKAIFDAVYDGTMPKGADKDSTAIWSDANVEKLRVAWNLPAR